MRNLRHASIPKFDVGSFCRLFFANRINYLADDTQYVDTPDATRPFAAYYHQHIFPQVKTFEAKRIEALEQFRKRSWMVLPVMLLVIALTAIGLGMVHKSHEFVLFVSFAALSGLVFYASMPVLNYKVAVKEHIFPKIFKFFGEEFSYHGEGLLSVRELEPSELIPSYDDEATEDYVKGSYDGVAIEFTEAKLTRETTDSKGRRRTTQVFRGMFVLFSMNKPFTGKTIIKRDGGWVGNWLGKKFNTLELVTLEDPTFEKAFQVYASDQVEARYLLTTSFMERLLQLDELYNRAGLQASFYGDKLLLMIPSRNRFETASIFYPATFIDDIRMILAEMHELFRVIDVLKLNQRIGL
ncbi:MAG: DUF3137 domain-containing protein [Rickettsiales bacterium]|nr:DUF3137 domain-containing protein [Rickettsiales bacterium]